jgi:4-hydroxyphenylacetate 3-monooxygenase
MDAGLRDDPGAFAARPETIGNVSSAMPMTGEQYLEELRDGREVYIYGDRVDDVTTHPAFRNTARMTARLYDALHDPRHKDKILTPTDTGNGGMTHAFFKAPKSMEDLLQGRSAIAEWAKITYGWIGRSPDYKASFLATLGANADFYDPFQPAHTPQKQKNPKQAPGSSSRIVRASTLHLNGRSICGYPAYRSLLYSDRHCTAAGNPRAGAAYRRF